MLRGLRRLGWSVYGRLVWVSPRDHAPGVFDGVLDAIVGAVPRSGRVLDAGCGSGDHAAELARRGFDVVGVDNAAGMIARARSRVAADDSRLRIEKMDLDGRLAFPEAAFDGALSVSSLQAVSDPMATLRELHRVLKPNGGLILLHAVAPDWHGLKLFDAVRFHWRANADRRVAQRLLTLVKGLVERHGGTRYWTFRELKALLGEAGFGLIEIKSAYPILLVCKAEKGVMVSRDQPAAKRPAA